MLAKNFEFVRSQKVPAHMEDTINAFLKTHSYRFANQCESPTTKKVVVTVFGEPVEDEKKATVRAKVFRSHTFEIAEKNVNEFLAEKIKLKWMTQTFIDNTITTVIFYE